MAGTLEAGVTLALANLVYVVLLVTGGVLFPLSKFPAGMRGVLEASPVSALSKSLRSVLEHGGGVSGGDVLTLVIWAAAALDGGGSDVPVGVIAVVLPRMAA